MITVEHMSVNHKTQINGYCIKQTKRSRVSSFVKLRRVFAYVFDFVRFVHNVKTHESL